MQDFHLQCAKYKKYLLQLINNSLLILRGRSTCRNLSHCFKIWTIIFYYYYSTLHEAVFVSHLGCLSKMHHSMSKSFVNNRLRLLCMSSTGCFLMVVHLLVWIPLYSVSSYIHHRLFSLQNNSPKICKWDGSLARHNWTFSQLVN